MKPIECRSFDAIYADELFALHDEATKLLNTMSGGRCLYVGEQRKLLLKAKEYAEACILEGNAAWSHRDKLSRMLYKATAR
jgi:hypothetical protein